jgi:hypothetical protein
MNRLTLKITAVFVMVLCLVFSSCAAESDNNATGDEISKTTEKESTVAETTQPETNPKPKTDDNNILLIGHRGYMGQYPESTIEAFSGAFNSGFDGIECDVWETKNGDLLIQHDPTTTRTTGKKKYIWNLSEKKRSKYPIVSGGNTQNYHSTKLIIPTLDEVLKVVQKNNGYLLLHIKDIKKDSKYCLSKSGRKKIISKLKKYGLKKKTLIFGGKKYVKPFAKKGFKTGVFTSPSKKKKFRSVAKWCKKNRVNTLVFANMKSIKKSGGGKRVSKYLKKKKLDFGVYKTPTGKAYRYLCRIGAWFSMSNFDIR